MRNPVFCKVKLLILSKESGSSSKTFQLQKKKADAICTWDRIASVAIYTPGTFFSYTNKVVLLPKHNPQNCAI